MALPWRILVVCFSAGREHQVLCNIGPESGEEPATSYSPPVQLLAVNPDLCDKGLFLRVNGLAYVGFSKRLPAHFHDATEFNLTTITVVFVFTGLVAEDVIQPYTDLACQLVSSICFEEQHRQFLTHHFSPANRSTSHDLTLILTRLVRDRLETGQLQFHFCDFIPISWNIRMDPPEIPVQPYHSLLLRTSDDQDLAKQAETFDSWLVSSLLPDWSWAIIRLVHASRCIKTIAEMAVETEITLEEALGVATSLVYWGHAILVYPVMAENVYVLRPGLRKEEIDSQWKLLSSNMRMRKRQGKTNLDELFNDKFFDVLKLFRKPLSVKNFYEKTKSEEFFSRPPREDISSRQLCLERLKYLLKHSLLVQLHQFATCKVTSKQELQSTFVLCAMDEKLSKVYEALFPMLDGRHSYDEIMYYLGHDRKFLEDLLHNQSWAQDHIIHSCRPDTGLQAITRQFTAPLKLRSPECSLSRISASPEEKVLHTTAAAPSPHPHYNFSPGLVSTPRPGQSQETSPSLGGSGSGLLIRAPRPLPYS